MASSSTITALEFDQIQTVIANILGTGDGDYGYNQPPNAGGLTGIYSSPCQGTVNRDSINPLIRDIEIASVHQIGIAPLGVAEIPANGSLTGVLSDAIIAAVYGKRNDDGTLPAEPKGPVVIGRTTMYPKGTSITRDIIGSAIVTDQAWNSTTTHTAVVTFSNADAMRCYFNAGCTIELISSKSGATSAKNTKWTSLFATIGTITFGKSKTSSSKATASSSGAGFDGLSTDDTQLFTKSTLTEVYTVNARLDGTNTIIFTVKFSNSGANVTGTLQTTVRSYRATRANDTIKYVSVPAPGCDTSQDPGTPDPSFTITKTPNISQLAETGKNISVKVKVNTLNFVGDTIYYSIVDGTGTKSPIIPEDFVKPISLSGGLAVTHTGPNGVSEDLEIIINADLTTEGLDKFNVDFRATDNLDDPVLITTSLTISDTSTTPKVLPRTIRFAALTVGKIYNVSEGMKASFKIIGTNIVAPNNTVTWRILPTITNPVTVDASDFDEGMEGTFDMPLNQNYTLDLHITADSNPEKLEQFQIELFLTDPATGQPNTKADTTSYQVQIASDIVVIPTDYAVLEPSVRSMEEGTGIGISVPFTTPYLAPSAAFVYYQVTTARVPAGNGVSVVNNVDGTDFTDKIAKGKWPVKITGNAGAGTLLKVAFNDHITEGKEGFIIEFFKDSAYTDKFGETPVLYITETTGYTVDRSAPSMSEPLTTGTTSTGKLVPSITFTLKTPYIPNTPKTTADWVVVPVLAAGGIGEFTQSDFKEGISGTVDVVNNAAPVTLTALNDGITEGTEQFFVRFTIVVDGVTITKDSPTASVTETVAYSIDIAAGSSAIMTEALAGSSDGVVLTIKTPYLPPNTTLYWETVADDKSSVMEKTDFTDGQIAGSFVINQGGIITNQYTLSRVAVIDGKTEGDESFRIILKTGTAASTKVATSPKITITENIKPDIYVAATSITEGAAGAVFKVTMPKTAVGTLVYWQISKGSKGTLTDSDFLVSDAKTAGTRQAMSGYVKTDKNNSASFTIAARQDSFAEDDEKFKVSISLDPNYSTIEASTPELNITDVSSYVITASTTAVRETDEGVLGTGRTVTFTVYTPYWPDNTTLYYTTQSVAGTITNSDFVPGFGSTQDSFKVFNNQATLTFKMNSDATTGEGNEKFAIQIRENSYSSPVVKNGTSPGVLIYDTSTGTNTTLDPANPEAIVTSLDNTMDYTEGDTIHLQITTTGVLTSDDLNWSMFSLISGGLTPYLNKIQSDAVFHVSGSGDPRTYTVPAITVTNTVPNEGARYFVFQVHKGSTATDPIGYLPLSIKDKVSYSVSVTNTNISELNNTGTQFNIITPPESYNTVMHWTIVPETGFESAIIGSDFNVPGIYNFNPSTLTGTVAIGLDGTGHFTLTAATDSVVEVTEKFRVKISKPLIGGGYEDIPNVQSGIVSIADLTNYTLTPSAVGLDLPALNYTVPAGTIVHYTLTTPKLAASNLGNPWVVGLIGSGLSGAVTAPAAFTVNATDTSYGFDVTTSASISDSKTFNVQIKDINGKAIQPANTQYTIKVAAPDVYTIIPKNSAGQVVSTITDTDAITFSVTSSTTPIYWYLAQTSSEETATGAIVSGDDFDTTQPLSGKLMPVNKSASFTLTFANLKKLKFGDKKFHVYLSGTAPSGNTLPDPIAVGATTGTITKTQAAAYTISPSLPSANEGTPITFTVTTPFLSTNTTFKWRVVPVSTGTNLAITTVTAAAPATQDTVGGLTGTFVVNASTTTGTVTITVPNDSVANTRTYQLEISNNSNVVVIPTTDTTKNPIITIGSDTPYIIVACAPKTTTPVTSVMEGDSLTFTITRPTTETTVKNVTWTVVKSDNTSTFENSHVKTYTGNATFANNVITFTIDTTVDNPLTRDNNVARIFKVSLVNKDTQAAITLLQQSNITITDYEYLSVVDDGANPTNLTYNPVLREGDTGLDLINPDTNAAYAKTIVFTITAKTSDIGSALKFTISGTKSTAKGATPLVATNFVGLTSLTGNTTTVGQDKKVTFSLTTVADGASNIPSDKTFSVTFARQTNTGVTTSNSCATRTVIIKDTSQTVLPPAYLIEDTGLPTIPATQAVINEGNVVTFTIHARPGDTGPMYYEIRPVTGFTIKSSDLVKAGDSTPLTSLTGSVSLTDRIGTLTLTSVIDKIDNTGKPKAYNVVFSTVTPVPKTQPDKNLISRNIKIIDTSKPDPVSATITHTLSESPAGCFVLPSSTFYVESKITPVDVVTPMTWRISGPAAVLAKIKYNGVAVDQSKVYTSNSSPSNRLKVTTAHCQFLSLTFTVDAVADAEDVCGVFKITFAVNQAGNPIEVSADINLNHLTIPVPITSNGLYPALNDLVGVDYLVVTLAGGAGGSGGDNGGRVGGSGGNGDIVTGIVPATPLYFNFIPGGPGGPYYASWSMQQGGSGGDAVAVYPKSAPASTAVTPYALAGGGGGGGSAWADTGSGGAGVAPTSSSTYYSSMASNPGTPSSGCGGTGGGGLAVASQGINDDNNSRGPRIAGISGMSYVPASWHRRAGANNKGAYATISLSKTCSDQLTKPIEKIDAGTCKVTVPAGVTFADLIVVGAGGGGGGAGGSIVTVNSTTYPTFSTTIVFTGSDNYYMNKFGIYGGAGTLTTDNAPILKTIPVKTALTKMMFRTSFKAPATPTQYNLIYQGKGSGYVKIDGKSYTFGTTCSKPQIQTIILNKNFTRLIEVSATMTATVYKNVEGVNTTHRYGGSAGALFNVTLTATTYTVTLSKGGTGYQLNDLIVIPGTAVGGTEPANNVYIVASAVNSTGVITKIALYSQGGQGIASYGTSRNEYCIAAWLVTAGNTQLDGAPDVTTNDGKYRETDVLWSTRNPCNVITAGVGISDGSSGAGGGSGSVIFTRASVTAGEVLTINVGAGGAGGTGQDHDISGTHSTAGSAGTASSIVRANGDVIASADGGGGGGTFTYAVPKVAAIGGVAGTTMTVAAGLTNQGSAGVAGKPGIRTASTSIGVSAGGKGGENISSYGKGGAGGAVAEQAEDTDFLNGDIAGAGYVAIAWRKTSSILDCGCTVASQVVIQPSISNVVMSCAHYTNGAGYIQVTFNDARWSTNVASYNVWYTSAGLGAGYPNIEYLLTNTAVSTVKSGTGITTGPCNNVWVTTFTSGNSNLTSGTLRFEALNATGVVLYNKTVSGTFTTSSFSASNDTTHVYTFNFS
jgi:hypothetical protein